MVDAIHNWEIDEIEGAQPFKAGDVDAKKGWVGSPLVMSVYATNLAKEVLRRASIEAIFGQTVLTSFKSEVANPSRQNHCSPHPAERAVTAAD